MHCWNCFLSGAACGVVTAILLLALVRAAAVADLQARRAEVIDDRDEHEGGFI